MPPGRKGVILPMLNFKSVPKKAGDAPNHHISDHPVVSNFNMCLG